MSMSNMFYSTETNVPPPPVEPSMEEYAANIDDGNDDQSDCDEEEGSTVTSIESG